MLPTLEQAPAAAPFDSPVEYPIIAAHFPDTGGFTSLGLEQIGKPDPLFDKRYSVASNTDDNALFVLRSTTESQGIPQWQPEVEQQTPWYDWPTHELGAIAITKEEDDDLLILNSVAAEHGIPRWQPAIEEVPSWTQWETAELPLVSPPAADTWDVNYYTAYREPLPINTDVMRRPLDQVAAHGSSTNYDPYYGVNTAPEDPRSVPPINQLHTVPLPQLAPRPHRGSYSAPEINVIAPPVAPAAPLEAAFYYKKDAPTHAADLLSPNRGRQHDTAEIPQLANSRQDTETMPIAEQETGVIPRSADQNNTAQLPATSEVPHRDAIKLRDVMPKAVRKADAADIRRHRRESRLKVFGRQLGTVALWAAASFPLIDKLAEHFSSN